MRATSTQIRSQNQSRSTVIQQQNSRIPPSVTHKHHQNPVTLQQYDDCELLWAQYGRQLSLSKGTILRSLQDVQRGALPCDAELLRERAAAFAALGNKQLIPGLDALRVLNSSRHALRNKPEHVQRTLQQLLQLLPGAPPTQLLLDTLADLDLPPEILALQHQEVDAAFRDCLGTHVTPKAFRHLLQRWRAREEEQQQQDEAGSAGVPVPAQEEQQQQREWPASRRQQHQQMAGEAETITAGAPQQQQQQPSNIPRPLQQQLVDLAEVLGPEVVHAAVANHPQLLDATPAAVLGNVRWLQQQLSLSPVAAVLLAETAGNVLLLPRRVLEARYNNLCYLLLQLMGWRLRHVHTLLCNAPQLLGFESAQLASSWQLVQQLARMRGAWLEEVAAGSQSLMVAVLCAEQRQLQQLRYAAEARELLGLGLVQVLRKEYVDFLFACPGFRVWRGLGGVGRWSLVDSGCIVVPGGGDAAAAAGGLPQGSKVLAKGKRGEPVLVYMGEAALGGPGERLVG